MLPKGKVVGHIEAESPQEADDNLIFKYNDKKQIISGQLPEKFRGFFDFKTEQKGET